MEKLIVDLTTENSLEVNSEEIHSIIQEKNEIILVEKKKPKKYFFVLVHGLMGSPLDFSNFKTQLSKKFSLKNTFIVMKKKFNFQVKLQSQSVRKNW
jgi:triacylglycerol esterase/lipase EstA (alpha/beta hydrolase family)